MKLIAYTRVSTDRQAEHGLGLQVQERAIRAWAKAEGHVITAWYSDKGVSGSNGLDSREGLSAAFRELKAGRAEGLVVYRLDRLARKLASQETWIEMLEKAGRKVLSVTEPEYGDDETRTLVRQVLGAISEYERAVIRRRMQSGRELKRSQGGYAGHGSPAFGTRSDSGVIVTDDAEAETVALIRQLAGSGMSLRSIAAELNARQVRSKRGGAWHPQTVARVLARVSS
jgi:DNA invertase Pin-like site-specific DNA recombinase